jgi:GTPase SAR1 family protein
LVYSVSSRSTFECVERYRDQVIRVKGTDVPMMLVGNMCDKITEREVSSEEGMNMARKLGCEFIECSSKTCVNVVRAFYTVVRMIRRNEICIKCSKEDGADVYGLLCKSCQINCLKKITTRCKNVKIDNLIQQMQYEVEYRQDTVFEWIPHNRLEKIKKVDENEVYSALLKDGPLNYNDSKSEYTRTQNEEVLLGYLYNTHDIINDFLDAIMLYKV